MCKWFSQTGVTGFRTRGEVWWCQARKRLLRGLLARCAQASGGRIAALLRRHRGAGRWWAGSGHHRWANCVRQRGGGGFGRKLKPAATNDTDAPVSRVGRDADVVFGNGAATGKGCRRGRDGDAERTHLGYTCSRRLYACVPGRTQTHP